jgi:hypothetical protein
LSDIAVDSVNTTTSTNGTGISVGNIIVLYRDVGESPFTFAEGALDQERVAGELTEHLYLIAIFLHDYILSSILY